MLPDSLRLSSLHNRLSDWWNDSTKQRAVLNLSAALLIAILAIISLVLRGPTIETTTVTVNQPTPNTKIVEVSIESGDTVLGIAVERYHMEPLAALGLNRKLLLDNTKRCDDAHNTKGVCRRENVAGYKLALDAAWPGQKVLVEVPIDATFASTRD